MYQQPYPVYYQPYWPAYYQQPPPQQAFYHTVPQSQCQAYAPTIPEAEPVSEDPLIDVTKSKIKVQRAVVHILKQLQSDSTATSTESQTESPKARHVFCQTSGSFFGNKSWKEKAQQLQQQLHHLQQEAKKTKSTASKWIAKAKEADKTISVLRKEKQAIEQKWNEESKQRKVVETQLKRLKKVEQKMSKLKCIEEAKELLDLQLTNVIATNLKLEEELQDLGVKYSQKKRAHETMLAQWKQIYEKNKQLREEKNNLVGRFAQVTTLNMEYYEKVKTVNDLKIEKDLLVTQNGILHDSNKELKEVQLHLFCKEMELCLVRAYAPEIWMCIHRFSQVINLRCSKGEQHVYFPLQGTYVECKERILKLHTEHRDLFNPMHWKQYKVDFNAIYDMMQPITLAFPFYEMVLDPDHYAKRPDRVDWLAGHVNPLLLLP